MQVRITGRARVLGYLDLITLDAELSPPCGVVRELQPRHMPRLGTVPPAIAEAGLADLGGDVADRLAGSVQVSVVDARLLDRVGEGPGDRDRLVGGRAEIVAPDRPAVALLPGLRVNRQPAFDGVVLALDQRTIGPSACQEGVDLRPIQQPFGIDPQPSRDCRMHVRPHNRKWCVFKPLPDAESEVAESFAESFLGSMQQIEIAAVPDVARDQDVQGRRELQTAVGDLGGQLLSMPLQMGQKAQPRKTAR
jgi:hypothetical protein